MVLSIRCQLYPSSVMSTGSKQNVREKETNGGSRCCKKKILYLLDQPSQLSTPSLALLFWRWLILLYAKWQSPYCIDSPCWFNLIICVTLNSASLHWPRWLLGDMKQNKTKQNKKNARRVSLGKSVKRGLMISNSYKTMITQLSRLALQYEIPWWAKVGHNTATDVATSSSVVRKRCISYLWC